MNITAIIRTSLRGVARNASRTTLTVIAIVIGAFTLTLTTAMGTGINSYLDTQVGSVGASNALTVTREDKAPEQEGPKPYRPDDESVALEGFSSTADVQLLTSADEKAVAKLPGITRVEPSHTVIPDYIEYEATGRYELPVNGESALVRSPLAAGTQLDAATTREILLPKSYLATFGFTTAQDAIGKVVSLGITDVTGVPHTIDATVRGVSEPTLFTTGATLNRALTAALLDLQLTGASETLQGPPALTAWLPTGATAADLHEVRSELEAAGFTVSSLDDQLGQFRSVVNAVVIVLNSFAGIALLAAGFGVVNTLLMSVKERTREIGLMRAMGLSGPRIFSLFSAEALIIGLLGSILGVGTAVAVGLPLNAILKTNAFGDLPGLNVLAFAPLPITVVVLVIMGITLLAGTLPAYKAARQTPMSALRHE